MARGLESDGIAQSPEIFKRAFQNDKGAGLLIHSCPFVETTKSTYLKQENVSLIKKKCQKNVSEEHLLRPCCDCQIILKCKEMASCLTLEQKNDSLIKDYRIAILVKKGTLKTLSILNIR